MECKDIIARVLVEAGEFCTDLCDLEINEPSFLTLVKSSLGLLNKYDPFLTKFNITADNRRYSFTKDGPKGLPEALTDVIPVKLLGVYPYYFEEFSRKWGGSRDFGRSEYLEEKSEFPYLTRKVYDEKRRYEKLELVLPIEGTFDIHAIYKHEIVTEDDGTCHVYTIDDEYENFFKILSGKFLKALGRNRRAFVHNDVPITTDADTLVSEGIELEREGTEALKEDDAKWYEAWNT